MRTELSTTHPSGWHAVVEVLRAASVETIFGLPDDDLTLLAALEREPIRLVLCRNQRNAVFMASGYALTSGRPAYCVVGRGPALANALPGLVEAATGRVPLVLLGTGTDAARFGSGAFQELDQLSLVRPTVKWAARVEDPALLAGILEKAALIAASGAPGPVYVELPATVGTSPAPRRSATDPGGSTVLALPSVAGVPAVPVPAALTTARRPLLLVGGGLRHGNRDGVLERLAEKLGAGLVVTASGRGAVDERHALFCGVAGLYAAPPVRELWRHTDLVVALGSRLEETACDGWDLLPPGTPVVQVNLDPADLSPRWAGPKVVADAVAAATAWAGVDRAEPEAAWREQIATARAQALALAQERSKQPRTGTAIDVLDVLTALDGTVGQDRILVQENGLSDMWSYFWPYWTCHSPGGSVVPSEQTSLGFGAAAAVGVALAAPQRPVVALVGDGAFNLFRSDLDTAATTGAGILYLVLDNGGYGWLQHQLTSQSTRSRFRFAGPDGEPGTAPATELPAADPDQPVRHRRVTDRTELPSALAAAWAHCATGRVAVVEIAVRLDDTPPCLWPADGSTGAGPAAPAGNAHTVEGREARP